MRAALESLELHPVRIPMRQRFRRVDHREAVLIRGPAGWGEFSPFPDYPPEVTTRWLAAAYGVAVLAAGGVAVLTAGFSPFLYFQF